MAAHHRATTTPSPPSQHPWPASEGSRRSFCGPRKKAAPVTASVKRGASPLPPPGPGPETEEVSLVRPPGSKRSDPRPPACASCFPTNIMVVAWPGLTHRRLTSPRSDRQLPKVVHGAHASSANHPALRRMRRDCSLLNALSIWLRVVYEVPFCALYRWLTQSYVSLKPGNVRGFFFP